MKITSLNKDLNIFADYFNKYIIKWQESTAEKLS